MQGKTHLAVGALMGLAVAHGSQSAWPAGVALCVAAGGLGGLVPDWLQVNVPGVKQIKGTFGHRGFSHWLWTPLVITYLAGAVIPPVYRAAFLAGWLSHLLLDALSHGAPVFWPLGRLTLARWQTGGRADIVICQAACIVLAVFAWRWYW